MSKAFTSEETAQEDDLGEIEDNLPAGTKNYMTPTGFKMLQDELHALVIGERPTIVETITWAAGNGDRSENGDYLYAKKRLREIDRRVRYLMKRLESAEIADLKKQQGLTQVFFGATVTYADIDDKRQTVTLVGVDEADMTKGKISWVSPVARALMKAKIGDEVRIVTPAGAQVVEIISIEYV